MFPWPRALLIAGLTGLLSACGGGGGGDSTVPVVTQTAGTGAVVPRYGPAGPSTQDSWTHAVDDGGQLVARYLGPTVVNTEAAHEFERVLTRSGFNTETQRYAWVLHDGPDVWHPLSGYSPLTTAFGPQPELLSGALRVGHRAQLSQGPVPVAADYDGDGRNDTASRAVVIDVIGVETQTSPAGTFTDCMLTFRTDTITIRFSGGQPPATLVTTSRDWSAPGGVGTVRYVSTEQELRQGVPVRSQNFGLTLTAYQVGELSGGTTR